MSDTLISEDGIPLKKKLKRAQFRQKMRASLLVAPLLLFIFISFILPIGDMLFRSVQNDIVPNTIPETVVAIQEWDGTSGDTPSEAVYRAFANDMAIAVEEKNHTRLGTRLNYENSGISSLFRKLGRQIDDLEPGPVKGQFIEFDDRWGEVATWETIKQYSGNYTAGYFIAAGDFVKTPEGIESREADERIYRTLFVRTIIMSLGITMACILLGYPVAWLLANSPARVSNLLMILVLLPFWTSLLVRTSAWKVLLQNQGVINDTLVWLGLVDTTNRLELINNQTGTIIAMTHILLPFMILPMYSVMKTIPPSYLRAAKSLGATNWTAFWRVYFPQSIPGIGAGAILCFIISIGYYITPELVGGTKGVFISNRIAYHISSSLNWGLAAALGAMLLVLVLVLYWLYDRIVGIDNVKLG